MNITLGRLLPLLAQHAGKSYPLMLKMVINHYSSEKAQIQAIALTLHNLFHVADKVLIEMGVPTDALAPAREAHQGGQARRTGSTKRVSKKRLQGAEMALNSDVTSAEDSVADSLESFASSARVIAAALTKIATNAKSDS